VRLVGGAAATRSALQRLRLRLDYRPGGRSAASARFSALRPIVPVLVTAVVMAAVQRAFLRPVRRGPAAEAADIHSLVGLVAGAILGGLAGSGRVVPGPSPSPVIVVIGHRGVVFRSAWSAFVSATANGEPAPPTPPVPLPPADRPDWMKHELR